MTSTLTSAPVAPLLAKLFAEADASNLAVRADLAKLAPGEIERLVGGPDYQSLYLQRAATAFLAVSREIGTLLYMLARSTRAKSIVEFGTSFGISTIHLAAALRDNGGGTLIGSEFEPAKLERARGHLAEAGLADLVEIRGGDALQSLAKDLPAEIDLVLMDGAKSLYPQILALVEPRLKKGALLLADNIDHAPDYVARVNGPGYLSSPLAEDIVLSIKLS